MDIIPVRNNLLRVNLRLFITYHGGAATGIAHKRIGQCAKQGYGDKEHDDGAAALGLGMLHTFSISR